MTKHETTSFISEVYTTAAARIDSRHYDNFRAGPDTWSALHRAVTDLITNPAVEGVRRVIPASQVQFWDADQATVVRTLRRLAEHPEQLDVLRDADADVRVEYAGRILADAFGYTADDWSALEQIASEAADRLRRLEAENRRLRSRLDECRGEQRTG